MPLPMRTLRARAQSPPRPQSIAVEMVRAISVRMPASLLQRSSMDAFAEQDGASVISQGYPNLEYFVLDGGSDGSPSCCRTPMTTILVPMDEGANAL